MSGQTVGNTSRPGQTWGHFLVGHLTMVFAFYYLTSLVVSAGVLYADDFVPLCGSYPGSQAWVDLISGFAVWDGEWYVRIATAGYSYYPERMSNAAFFPLYPRLTGA